MALVSGQEAKLRESVSRLEAQLAAAIAREQAAGSRLEGAEARAKDLEKRCEEAMKQAARSDGRAEVLEKRVQQLSESEGALAEELQRAARAEGQLEAMQHLRESLPDMVQNMMRALVSGGRRPRWSGSLGDAVVKLEIEGNPRGGARHLSNSPVTPEIPIPGEALAVAAKSPRWDAAGFDSARDALQEFYGVSQTGQGQGDGSSGLLTALERARAMAGSKPISTRSARQLPS